jgi:uncharacterized membrane protein YkvA (DUF1232 family)
MDNVKNSNSRLEEAVKKLLKEQSLSMRQLASLTGINIATLSKMIRGKQKINPEYLQRIAKQLSVAPHTLFAAAGYDIGTSTNPPITGSFDYISEILKNVGYDSFSKQTIERELSKYDSYVKTSEGHELIVEKFPLKRKQIFGSGPFIDDLDEMYRRYLLPETSEEERFVLGSGLLYFVLSADAIPDYLFPIGYLDDALVVQITKDRLDKIQGKHGLPENA